ncbi:Hypothetical protein PEIBARAKI_5851 [Petrimonas sp. IBARAKI]|nr:Hypothetical protein PEIBARAKI_5851 [Petrimonas sp. IBARAKI]
MSSSKLYLALILFAIISGCTDGNKQSTDKLITVDVTKTNYPKKELILQDFMDVEYIPLETNDEFLNQGFVQDVGKEIILVRNRTGDGNIFVYDRNGKALRVINRKGQGGEEYVSSLIIRLDEENGEIFINDHSRRKIVVYDLNGKYKRSFNHKEGGGSMFYTEMFNYDKDNLICYDEYNKEISFVIVSKKDGSITKEIKIPYKERLYLEQQKIDRASETTYTISPGYYRTIIPFKGDWFLLDHSCDTIYSLLPDYSIHPSIARTPPIRSMDPGVFLMLRQLSDHYFFFETIKNVFDWDTERGFPKTFMMYDRQEKAFFNYTVYNGDYSTKKELYMNWLRPVNHEIESWQPLEAHQLVESYKKGELKGRLKEIAATLNEESNPVIMLIKHKN